MAAGSIKRRELSRGRVRWDAVLDLGTDNVTGERLRRKQTFTTKKEATTALAAWKVEGDTGTVVARSATTVKEYLEYWLEHVVQHNVRPATYLSYQQIVHHRLVPTLGNVPLQKLTPDAIQRLYSHLLTNGRVDGQGTALSPRSVAYAHIVLKAALKEALRKGLVVRNVADAATPPRGTPSPVGYWTIDETQRFLEAVKDRLDKNLWTLYLHTGMRRGELLGLHWADVDLDAAVLHVRWSLTEVSGKIELQPPKTASGRRAIALDATCVAALREQRTRQKEMRLAAGAFWQEGDFVFTMADGAPLRPGTVSHTFLNLRKQLNVAAIPLHGTRHTHATLLMKQGTAPKVASARLGHANITTTLNTYSHVMDGMQEQAARAFDTALTATQ